MKKAFIILLISMLAATVFAQINMSEYSMTYSAGTYSEITGGTVLGTISSDDQRFADPANLTGVTSNTFGPGFPIGFDFTFGGVVYDRFGVSANGVLYLGQSALGTSAVYVYNSYVPISVTYAIDGDQNLSARIAPFTRDLQAQAGAEIMFLTTGTAPNQELVLQWKNYKRYGSTGTGDSYNFQIRLQQSGNNVAMVYGAITNNATATTVQVGLRSQPSGTASNWKAMTTTTDWTAPTAGATSGATMTLSNTVVPPSGTTYTWAPPVAGSAPNPAVLVAPADAATGVGINPTLSWGSGGGLPSGFNVYFNGSLVSSNQAGMTYMPGPLAYSTTYTWQIIPINEFGAAVDCPVWSFTTAENPVVSSFPFTEGFESGNTDASTSILHWTQEFVTGTKSWTANSSLTTYGRTPRTGSFNVTLGWSASTWMFRPVQLTAGTSYDVEVWARQDMSNATLASMTIAYGTEATAAGMTDTIVSQTSLVDGSYQRLFGSFTPSNSGIYYIGILGNMPTATNWYISLDDITIRETPTVPMISVDPNTWDYGTKLIYTTTPKAFAISNVGGAPLNISSVNVSGTGFALAVPFSPVSLLPNESTSITVNFAPTTATTHSGNIAINDNRAVTNIPLTGDALDATIYSGDLPYLQNFDSVTPPAFPLGWEPYISSSSSPIPVVDVRTSGTPNTNPNHVYLYNQLENSTGDVIVLSPPIGVSLNTIRTKFHAKGGGAGYTLQVGTWSGSTFTLYQSIPLTTTYAQYAVDFSSYAGTDTRIAYRHGLGSTYRTIYIDDVIIEVPAPIAPEPATVAFPLDGMTTFVDPLLKWTPSASGEPALSYKVYLNQTGTFSEGDLVYEGTALQYQTTGLSNGRTYYWKVLPTNNYGSDPTCPTWSFSTPGPDQLAESFDATAFPPAGWANGTSGNWTRSTATPLFHGTGHAYKFTSTTVQYQLSTPLLTINNGDTLDFWTRATTTAQILQVAYSEDRVTWTQLGANITYAATGVWYQQSFNLSELAGNNYYLAFQTGLPTATGSIYVDHVIGPDITPVRPGAPTLTAPLDAAVNQSRYPSLSWSAPTTGGVPTGYNVYLDTVDGSTLFAGNVTSPYTLTTPLEWDQTYYWTVKAFNAAGTGDAPAARSFTVMSDPTIYDLPYAVDFGTVAGDWPVAGWSQLHGFYPTPIGTTAQWFQDDWLNVTTPANKAAKINIYGTLRYGWLVTPPIAIPADGYELKFDAGLVVWNGTTPPTGTQVDDRFMVIMSDTPTMTNPTILREWNNTGSPWVFNDIPHTGANYTIPLTGISGTKYFAFYGESSIGDNGDNDLMVDNVMIRQTPTGPPDPVTLTSPSDGATDLPIGGFNLTWADALTGGTPIEYTVYMGTTEDVADYAWYNITGTSFDPTQDEFDPITYNYGETWYWTVQAINGDGDADVPTPFSFTIMDDPRILSLPYSQNFDGVPTASMPAAWAGYVNSTSTTAYVRTITTYPVSAPNSMYMTTSADANADLRLITPDILVPMNSIKLSFSARAGSVGPNLLVGTVDALDGTGTFNELASIPMTTTHTVYTVSFADYLGTDTNICFKHGAGGTYRSIYIDDVYMEELVDTDMSVVSLTGMPYGFQNTPIAHTVTVKNNGTEPVSNYTVYLKSVETRAILGQESFTDPLAADATNAVEFTWTPTSLGAMDIYGEVYVADDAVAENNTSELMSFNVYQEGILFESFEGGVIPANWTVLNADGGTQVWQATTVNPRTGTYAARVRYETSTLDNDDWLITPPLQVTSGTTDNISFWMRSYSATDADPWQVLISTTDTNPASFSMIDEGDGNMGAYVQKSYNLDSYGDAVIYLAVRYMGAYDWYLYVDDFIGPPIFTPTTLATPDVTISTVGSNVVLNWDAIPYATSYEVMAADAPEGSWTLASTVTAPTYSSAATSKKFFKVIAKAGATRSITTQALSLEQQLLQDEMDKAARSRQ